MLKNIRDDIIKRQTDAIEEAQRAALRNGLQQGRDVLFVSWSNSEASVCLLKMTFYTATVLIEQNLPEDLWPGTPDGCSERWQVCRVGTLNPDQVALIMTEDA